MAAPKPVVTAAPPAPSRGRGLRMGAAVSASLVTHGALAGLFLLVVSAVPADPGAVWDPAPDTLVISPDPHPDDEPRANFLSVDANLAALTGDADASTNSLSEAEQNVVGPENPLREVGRPDGELAANLPSALAPPPGFAFATGASGIPADGPGTTPGTGARGVLVDYAQPNASYLVRGDAAGTRQQLLEKFQGSPETEAAVVRGLKWLQRQQSPDGRWMLDSPAFPDRGSSNDTAGTALGLLPFLGAGKTHRPDKGNPYDQTVAKGVRYLIGRQDRKTGNLGGGLYGHGLATIALCEAYGLSQDPNLRRPAQLAVNYVISSQHDGGGWRYSPGQPGDTSVSGWQIMALKSAQMAGLDVPAVTLRKAERFLDGVRGPDAGYGYTGPGSTPTLSAVALLCRQYLQHWGPQNPQLIAGIEKHLQPTPPGAKRDAYYYYYATQVMFHFGGDAWTRWNAGMRETLVKSQHTAGDPHHGSWAAAGDAWGGQGGGRLMVTSLNLLTLEVYYRYLPLYHRDAAARRDAAPPRGS